jgi:hypothetical protein
VVDSAEVDLLWWAVVPGFVVVSLEDYVVVDYGSGCCCLLYLVLLKAAFWLALADKGVCRSSVHIPLEMVLGEMHEALTMRYAMVVVLC